MSSSQITMDEALAELKRRQEELEGYDKSIEQQIRSEESKPALTELEGLIKAYMKIIKSYEFNARPSCVSALQKAESRPSDATIRASIRALSDHAKEIEKAEGKGPHAKDAKSFGKDIVGLVDDLELILDAIKDRK